MFLRSFLTFFCSFCILSAQDSEIDSEFGQIFMKGYHHITTDRDSAYFYFDKALEIAKHNNKKEDLLYIYDFLTYTDSYHYALGNYKSHLNSYEKVVTSISPIDSIKNIGQYLTQVLVLKGNYYYKMKDNPKSKYYFEELYKKMSVIDVGKMNEFQISTYLTSLNYMGLINMRQGKLTQSEFYFKNAINFCRDYRGYVDDWEERLYNNKKLLSNIYSKQNNFEQAIILLKESIEFFEKNYETKYKNLLVISYLQITENYLLQDSIQIAAKMLKKIDRIITPNDHFNKEKKLMSGDLHKRAKEYGKAALNYEAVLHETILYRNGIRHQDVASIYMKLGDLERDRNQLKESLNNYQKALISVSKSFEKYSIVLNPKPQNVFSKTQLLEILRKKLEVINQSLLQTKNQELMVAAENTSKSLIATLDALRPEFESKLDKKFLIDQTYPAFHEMIQAAYTAHTKTGDSKYLEDAFLYFEKSKGILLLEAVKNAEAISFGGVPESVLDKEQQYRAYIANAEKKLLNAEKKEKTILNDSLFKLNADYYNFLSTIEKEYPKYYKLKYDTKTTGLNELQAFIESDEKVISFHQTEEALFTLVTTKSAIEFLKIPFSTDIKNDIDHFYKLLSKPTVDGARKIKILSESIYEQILAPCIGNNSSKNLTIIADGLLNYIPFDVLIDKKSGDYLMKNKNTRYVNSATLLTSSSSENAEKESSLLAISPSFNANDGFGALPFSKRETALISGYFKGKVLSGANATMKNFKAIKDDYSMIHFATHASANDDEPDFSYLAFATRNNENNRLHVKDLYNYNLNAEMVTLSACESGIGQLQNGEGMLSLARGFQYAGVPSLTTTLWKNDDQSTSVLMGYYYKHLKEGLTKSKALQKAKLEYLNTTEEVELKHPYYWAGFVVLGDNAPVSDKPISPWLLLGFGLMGTGILVFGYKKFRAHRGAA